MQVSKKSRRDIYGQLSSVKSRHKQNYSKD